MRRQRVPWSRDRREVYVCSPPDRTSISNLRQIGRELGVTHRQLSTLLGISLATLEHWLSGRTAVPLPITLALAQLRTHHVKRRYHHRTAKRKRLLTQSLELRPPPKQKFY